MKSESRVERLCAPPLEQLEVGSTLGGPFALFLPFTHTLGQVGQGCTHTRLISHVDRTHL
jgi:hypothetical protein